MTSFFLCECSEKSVCHCTSRSRLLRRKIKQANVYLVCVSDGVSSANRQEKLEGEGTRRSNSTGMSDLSETAAAHTLHVIAGRVMGLAINWQAAPPPPRVLSQKYRERLPPSALHLQFFLQASTTKPGHFHQANLEHQQQTGRLGETKEEHGWRGNT